MKLVWHRRDLRTSDNRALKEAGEDAAPVYIFDLEWMESELVSDSRIEFVLESLKDLNRQYVEKGSHLAILQGNPIKKLKELQGEGNEIFFNLDANHFRQEREEEVREKFRGLENSAVKDSGSGDPEEWEEDTKNWFREERIDAEEDTEIAVAGAPVEDEAEEGDME